MLVVFEGIDGSGKTALSHAVKMGLERACVSSIVTSELGRKDAWSVRGKAELLAAKDQREQYIAVMHTRLQHSARVLDTAPENAVVLMDRYLPSTIAYQSCASLPATQIWQEHKFNCLPAPTLIFYIQVRPEVAMARTRHRGQQDSFDTKSAEYFSELHQRYLAALEELKTAWRWEYQVIQGELRLSDLVKSCVASIMQCVNKASKEVA